MASISSLGADADCQQPCEPVQPWQALPVPFPVLSSLLFTPERFSLRLSSYINDLIDLVGSPSSDCPSLPNRDSGFLTALPAFSVTTRRCTAPGSLDTYLSYAAWRSSYSSRASIGV